MFQKGYGLGDLFRNIIRPVLKPVLREAKGIGKDVGMDLAENLLSDLIAGKTSKASVKTRGKEVKNLAGQRAIQAILRGHRGGNGSFNGNQVPSGSNLSSETAKRERSRSKSPPPKRKQTRSKSQPPKRKRAQSKSQPPKRKRTQTGGVQPPIHYPLGNYPRFQTGGWIWRPSTGLVKGGGKRKQTKKRTGKRKPRKQTGGRRTGKKRKPRKQSGGRRDVRYGDIFGI